MREQFIEYATYEEYVKDNHSHAEAQQAYADRVRQATEEHTALVAEYEQLIATGVASGKDVSTQLDELDAKITAAERNVTRRRQEYAVAMAAKPSEKATTALDVVEGHVAYAQSVRAAEVEPFKVKMREARQMILEAVADYEDARHQYDDYLTEIRGVSKVAHVTGQTVHRMALNSPFNGVSVQGELYKIEKVLNGQEVYD